MHRDVLLAIVRESPREDWDVIPCWGSVNGPSYRERFSAAPGAGVESHAYVAVYIPDVSITVAWGLTSLKKFSEPWHASLADPSASSDYVDIFFNGALVYRTVVVSVDGGRCYLPIPDNREGVLTVSSDYAGLAQKIDELTHPSQFDDYFEHRVGFKRISVREGNTEY